MKNTLHQVSGRRRSIALLSALMTIGFAGAQDTAVAQAAKPRPVKNTFAGSLIIDNQTVMVPAKGVFEFVIQHRFGTMGNGYSDLLGFYAPSNIRLGFAYTPVDRLQLGVGLTKERMMWDGNVKYALLKQRKGEGSPVSVTYYGLMAVDTRKKEGNFVANEDRFSYFHQLLIARKVTEDLSLQVAPGFSWYNNVEGYVSSDGSIKPKMENFQFGMSFMASYAFTNRFAFIVNYDQPLSAHPTDNPEPNISFGLEAGTSTHTFQLFVGNYQKIVPQANSFFNHNNYRDGMSGFLIGFNITKR